MANTSKYPDRLQIEERNSGHAVLLIVAYLQAWICYLHEEAYMSLDKIVVIVLALLFFGGVLILALKNRQGKGG